MHIYVYIKIRYTYTLNYIGEHVYVYQCIYVLMII